MTPVETFDPTVLGLPLPVAEGFFLFTMPNAQLSDVAGLPPRTSHPISDLDDVAIELGIVDWMFDVRDKADESGILPADWPAELGGEGPEEPPTEEPPIAGDGYNVVSSGGVLVACSTSDRLGHQLAGCCSTGPGRDRLRRRAAA